MLIIFSVLIIELFVNKELTSNDTIILVIFNNNISDIVGKRGRILGVVIIFNKSFKALNYSPSKTMKNVFYFI